MTPSTQLVSAFPLLGAIVWLPLALGILALFPGRPRTFAAAAAPWTALPALLWSLFVPPGRVEIYDALFLGTRLGYDETARVFMLFTSLLWVTAGVFAQVTIDESDKERAPLPRTGLFWIFYLLTASGSLAVTVSRDLPNFLVSFTLMGFASYGLVVFHRGAQQLRAGRVYMLVLVLGDALLYAAAVMAARVADSLTAADIARAVGEAPDGPLIAALFLVGFGFKAGFIGLHVALPPAYESAPAAAGALLSGALSKAGVLGWILFLPLGVTSMPILGQVFLFGGLAATWFGIAAGLGSRTPKAMLAYSSISQIGFMTLLVGVGLIAPQLWDVALVALLIYAMHHGLTKGALFLGTRLADDGISGRAPRMLFLAALLLPILALAGAPWTSGAVAKHGLKGSLDLELLGLGGWVETAVVSSAIGTALLLMRFLFAVWPRENKVPARPHGVRHWVPLATLVLAAPLAPWLFPWEGMRHVARETLVTSEVISASWPLAVAAVIVATAVAVARRTSRRVSWRVPAGDVLELYRLVCRALLELTRVAETLVRGLSSAATSIARTLTSSLLAQEHRLRRAEAHLGSWHVGAALTLAVAVTILLLSVL